VTDNPMLLHDVRRRVAALHMYDSIAFVEKDLRQPGQIIQKGVFLQTGVQVAGGATIVASPVGGPARPQVQRSAADVLGMHRQASREAGWAANAVHTRQGAAQAPASPLPLPSSAAAWEPLIHVAAHPCALNTTLHLPAVLQDRAAKEPDVKTAVAVPMELEALTAQSDIAALTWEEITATLLAGFKVLCASKALHVPSEALGDLDGLPEGAKGALGSLDAVSGFATMAGGKQQCAVELTSLSLAEIARRCKEPGALLH